MHLASWIIHDIYSNITGIRSDPKFSCWIPTAFKFLTLLSIRSYNSLNSVKFETFTLFNYIISFQSVEIISWVFPYLSFKSSDARIQLSFFKAKFWTGCSEAFFKQPIKYVNFSILDILSFLCTAASNDSPDCFHFIMFLSNNYNTNFSTFTPAFTLKLSMFWLWTVLLSVFFTKSFNFNFLI